MHICSHWQTINDLIVGIMFYGIRLYMQEMSQESTTINATTDSHSTALVLLNTRMLGGYKSIEEMTKPEADMPWGNRFAFLHIPIPNLAQLSNPLDFVLYCQKAIDRKRNSLAVYLNGSFLEIMKKIKGPNVGL